MPMQHEEFDAVRAWYITALLGTLYVFSFVDRLIIGLLAVDISRDVGLSDTQLGILIGTSFAFIYALMGLPIAHLLDRRSRKWLLVAGVGLWSLCTIASGFADSFELLAISRVGVATGEAVLTPAAVSLVGDIFPREKRVAPMVAYSAVASMMIVGGLAIGAAALQIAQQVAPAFGLAPWRLTFVFVGLPPLMLAVLFALTTREPPRGAFDTELENGARSDASLRACWRYLVEHCGFYFNFYIATALIAIFIYGFMTWTPTLLIRGYAWDQAEAGYAFGLTGLIMGLAGLIAWPRLALAMKRRGIAHHLVLAITIGAALCFPAAVLIFAAENNVAIFAGLGLAVFAATATNSLSPLTIQHYAPPKMRARLTSLFLLAMSLVGYGAGPAMIARVAATWPDSDRALGLALGSTAIVTIPLATLFYWLSRRSLRAMQRRTHAD